MKSIKLSVISILILLVCMNFTTNNCDTKCSSKIIKIYFSHKQTFSELVELQSESEVPFTVGLINQEDLFKWSVVIMG